MQAVSNWLNLSGLILKPYLSMTPLMKKIAIQFGVLNTVITVLYVLGIYIVDEALYTSRIGGVLILLATLLVFVWAVIAFKKQNGGYATFREAFSAFILPFIVAALLGMAFNLTFYNLVDADLAARNGERQFDLMLDMPEDQLQATMKFMGASTTEELHATIMEQSLNAKSLTGQLKTTGGAIAIFALLGLVVAAITKKKRPEFE